MIDGWVDEDGIPWFELPICGRNWRAIVDTGFNGHVELPLELEDQLAPLYIGTFRSELAGGWVVDEKYHLVSIPFDGRSPLVEATFVEGEECLVGTELLAAHRLEIDFPARTVRLERLDPNT